MNTASNGRGREKVLATILMILVLIVWLTRRGTTLDQSEEPLDRDATRQTIARLQTLAAQSSRIRDTLGTRQKVWLALQAGMMELAPTAVLLSSTSQKLREIANDSAIELGAPTVVLDSSGEYVRVRSRATLRGEPESISTFLQTLNTDNPRFRTRSLQLTRVAGTGTAVLQWAGTIEVEALVQPPES